MTPHSKPNTAAASTVFISVCATNLAALLGATMTMRLFTKLP